MAETQIQQNKSNSFDLIISNEVESKIRQLLHSIYNIEWSGILFYTYKGTFKDANFKIICKDVFPMNIGNSTFTSFEITPDVAAYMVENDLTDTQMGLIHSHHSMSTFFSGTDMKTLAEEGKTRNNFLSLIVNNAGTYSAKITYKEVGTIKKIADIKTPFFDQEEVSSQVESEEETVNVKYYDLRIVKNEIELPELDARIAELKKQSTINRNSFSVQSDKLFDTKYKELELFDSNELPVKSIDGSDFDIDYDGLLEIPEKIIESSVAQLLTGNITASKMPNDITPNIFKAINSNFINRFKGPDGKEDTTSTNYVLESLVTTVIEDMCDKFSPEEDTSVKMSCLATECIKRLKKYETAIPAAIPLMITKLKLYELE